MAGRPDPGLTMIPVSRRGSLFEDRHVERQMRALIPRYAVLGCAATLVGMPMLARSGPAAVAICVNVTLALAVTYVAVRSGLLGRMDQRLLAFLLVVYGAQIAFGTSMTGDPSSAYALLQVLPVLFAAVFFVGFDRYLLTAAVWAAETVVLEVFVGTTLVRTFMALVFYLLVAQFGAEVADVVHHSLRAKNALHSVLEQATGNPLGAELAQTGLAAALAVCRWDAGGVVLAEGDSLPVVAIAGLGDDVAEFYRARPMRRGDSSLSSRVMETGEVAFVEDVAEFLGPDHVLTRHGIRRIAGVPIRYHGEVIGVLLLDSREHRELEDRERDQLTEVAEQLGLALGSARLYRREAEVSERLRELNQRKDDFLAVISHELRTPATTIRVAARTLVAAGDRLTPAERAEIHERIAVRTDELCDLLESLLEEALAERGDVRLTVQPVDWAVSLDRWVATAEVTTQRAVERVLAPDLGTSLADPLKVERIVANLLSNAAKFSPAASPIRLGCERADGVLRVSVTDEGVGIPATLVDQVFDRFFQVDSSSTREWGGVGIGLSLAQRFALAHGGRLTVTSQEGTGSTFTLELPWVPVGALPTPRTAVAAPASRLPA
jgi:signal transduction histidine kinase